MKNIIVPTDFSGNAKKALQYAINIANQYGSTIYLVNGIDIIAATGIYTDVNNMLYETAMNNLNEVISMESQNLENNVSIIPKALRGEVAGAICDFAKETTADLIVMGTKGATGLKEIFIGTIAKAVIKDSPVPVLVIPKETETLIPEKVALAVDDIKSHSKEVLHCFKNLVKIFDAKVTVFHFNQEFSANNEDEILSNYLEDIDYATHNYYSDEKDVNKVIEDFVASEHIDLLTMIRKKRSFFDQLFHKSITSKEVFHSKIPILILYGK